MTEKKRLSALPWTDGIRGLACLYVILWHAFLTLTPKDPTPGQQIFSLPVAVSARSTLVLFVLFSGYLLGRYWRGGFAKDDWWAKTKQFALRRTLRIVIPFWAAVTFTIIAMLVLNLREPQGTHWDSGLPLTWIRVMANYLMITDVWDQVPLSHPHWTVPLEYHLYLFAPLVVLLRHRWAAMALGVSLTLVAIFVLHNYHAPMFPFGFVVGFWCGLRRQSPVGTRFKDTFAITWPIVACAFLLLVVAATLGTPSMNESTRNYFLTDALVTAVFMVWMFWVDVSNRDTWVIRLLSARIPRWLGDRSFSIYLVHAVVLEATWRFLIRPLGIDGATPNFLILWPVASLLTLVVAIGFYQWVEAPSARKSAQIGKRGIVSSPPRKVEQP